MTLNDHTISVGILGLGGIGSTHARALATLSRSGAKVRVEAFSGGSPEQAADCGWPDARQLRPEELIADAGVDVLAVCSPSALHAPHTLSALRAGKHVVVEKPMALTVQDATEICARAADDGLVVSPVAQRRFEPLNVELRALLSSNRLGRVVLGETFVHWFRSDSYYADVSWRTDPDGGGGSLMNQGLHNVDLLCWLLDGVATVTGHTANRGHDMAVEDTAVASVEFACGALGVIATTTATPPGVPSELALWTTTGSVQLDQSGIRYWNFPGIPRPDSAAAPATGASDPAAIGIAGHVAQWTDVVDALITGSQPSITAADGLTTVAVLDGIYRAAELGTTIDVGSTERGGRRRDEVT